MDKVPSKEVLITIGDDKAKIVKDNVYWDIIKTERKYDNKLEWIKLMSLIIY